jgi:hypothetical protein
MHAMRKRVPSLAAVDRLILSVKYTTVGRTTLCFAELQDGSVEVGCWCDTRGALDPEAGPRMEFEQVSKRLAWWPRRIKPRWPLRRSVPRPSHHLVHTE